MSKFLTTTLRMGYAALLLCGLAGQQAQAHAHLRQATPAAGATVTPAPHQLDLYFSESIEPAFSTAEVTGGDGSHVDAGPLALAPGDAKHAIVALKPLPPGRYHVIWHATATDTHRTQGSFDFAVGTGSTPSAFIVRDGWARPTVPSITVGAIYLAVTNAGAGADRLTSVETPVAAKAELHVSQTDGMTGGMRPLADVALPAGATAVFKPLDKHIMLVGLKAPLTLGQHFPLTLHFASGVAITTDILVARGDRAPDKPSHATEAMPDMKM